ncbi:MAG: stage II sporulation protein E [Bacillota bacterium]
MFVRSDLSTYERVDKEQNNLFKRIFSFIINLFLEVDLLHICYVGLGLMLGRASLLDRIFPFGLAFLGVALYQKVRSSEKLGRVIFFISSLYLGLYTALGWSWQFSKYLFAGTILSLIASYLIYQCSLVQKAKWAVISGSSLLVVELVDLLLITRTLYNQILLLLGPILVGVLTLILLKGLLPVFWSKSKVNFDETNALALLITLAAFNIGLPNINLGIVNLSRVFSSLVIMIVALKRGSSVATVVGVVLGLFYGISGSYIMEVTGLYALAGLVSGHFKSEGKLGVVTGFTLTVLLYTIFLIEVNNINSIIAEALLAGAILTLIPQQMIKLSSSLLPQSDLYFTTQPKRNKRSREQKVVSKVNQMVELFGELATAFTESSVVDKRSDSNLEELLSLITNQVCLGCEFYDVCWDQEFFATYQQIVDALAVAEEEGGISAQKLNAIRSEDCQQPVRLSEVINRFLEKYETNSFWQQKIKESKEIIGNQLSGVADLLNKMVADLEMEVKFDNNFKQAIRSELESHGIFLEELAINKSEEIMKLRLTKPSCNGCQECTNKIIPILNQVLNQNFKIEWSACGGSLGEDNCTFELTSAARYWVETGVAQISPRQESVSGDNYEIIDRGDKETVTVLSDGMGTGQRAAVESNTTVNLLGKLIAAGFDKKLAIKVVNSALLLRSTEESFATLNISTINRYNGQGEFIKIGSGPTFIKRDNRNIELIKSSSLPVGIIDNIDIELTQQTQLLPGDLVVMVTDGVLELTGDEFKQEEWLSRLLRNNLIDDPQSLAEYILQQAVNLRHNVTDDMTVVVAKLNGYQNK